MKQTLQFSATITNPAGIEWVIGSGADVGADLYMVAPVGSASVPSPSALYELDPTTGEATILGALGVVDPTDIAWDKDGSTMYLIDKDSDAPLYRQANTSALALGPVAPGDATGLEYLPNAGDLYYNGGNFADAFMRWDNPKWTHDDDDCKEEDTDCSTYEHDLALEWSNTGGWFADNVPRTYQHLIPPFIGYTVPGWYRTTILGLRSVVPYRPPGVVPAVLLHILGSLRVLPEELFCTTWSDLPDPYDDCHTAGVAEDDPNKAILSFGTYKAPDIVPGRDYYGYWSFKNLRGGMTRTSVSLYGQEGEYRRHPLVCPIVTKSNWCVFGIDGRQDRLTESRWIHGTPKYVYYTRP